VRKSVTVLLTLLLSVLVIGIGAAVASPDILEEALDRHKDAYQPKEFDYLSNLGMDPETEDDPADDGVDFGEEDEEEDYGIDFGDE